MSRRRQLSEEERTLWSGFVRSITPLRGEKLIQKPPSRGEGIGEGPPVSPSSGSSVSPQPPAPPKKAPPLAPLGRRLKQRVARGREAIDARLDLHGRTQKEAHTQLLVFLRRAQADGAKIVLVVTGKGKTETPLRGHGATERGVLKRQVPMWLSLPEFRALVVGFEEAHVGHGGHGALYIRLRRGH